LYMPARCSRTKAARSRGNVMMMDCEADIGRQDDGSVVSC
jgi:hypothetical protein